MTKGGSYNGVTYIGYIFRNEWWDLQVSLKLLMIDFSDKNLIASRGI